MAWALMAVAAASRGKLAGRARGGGEVRATQPAAVFFRDGCPVVEGGAGQGEVLRGLQVRASPDQGVVAGAPVAQYDAKRVCGHDTGSFYRSMTTRATSAAGAVSAGGLLL